MRKVFMFLFMGSLGILTGIFGIPEGYPFLSAFFPFLSFLPCIIFIGKDIGWKNGALLLILLSVYSLIIETIGLLTGFPYGSFVYSSLFTYKIFSITPIIVPFAWVPLCIGAFAISSKYTASMLKKYTTFLLFLVGADFVIDPGAASLHLWRYLTPGIYYAIPFSNFLGWLLTGTIAFFIMQYLLKQKKLSNTIGYNYFFILLFWTCICGIRGVFLPFVIGTALLIYVLYTFKSAIK